LSVLILLDPECSATEWLNERIGLFSSTGVIPGLPVIHPEPASDEKYLSNGANMVEYWHWASIPANQETYWKGVLSHDVEPNRTYAEVSRTAHELQKIGS
jgi:hypothetical protein